MLQDGACWLNLPRVVHAETDRQAGRQTDRQTHRQTQAGCLSACLSVCLSVFCHSVFLSLCLSVNASGWCTLTYKHLHCLLIWTGCYDSLCKGTGLTGREHTPHRYCKHNICMFYSMFFFSWMSGHLKHYGPIFLKNKITGIHTCLVDSMVRDQSPGEYV